MWYENAYTQIGKLAGGLFGCVLATAVVFSKPMPRDDWLSYAVVFSSLTGFGAVGGAYVGEWVKNRRG